KPEELSASRTVAKKFIEKFLASNKDFEVQEVDLYKEHIPRLEYEYFEQRSAIVNKEALEKLDEKQKTEVKRIVELCEQFKGADAYVVAVPMWSLSFPAPLKEYLDCVVQDGRTIKILEDKVEPLLEDKHREFIYVQSSGAKIPWILKPILNRGLNYVEDIVKYMGIKNFHSILVDGTGKTKEEKLSAITGAINKLDDVINDIRFN
ncbi:MAG: NAD(P)H-dependent oxidoreductase, partial [Clostridium perfringens]|nr:NAD(P)H-dependent oxidoreductase [Clostridium perfringens]